MFKQYLIIELSGDEEKDNVLKDYVLEREYFCEEVNFDPMNMIEQKEKDIEFYRNWLNQTRIKYGEESLDDIPNY